LQFAAWIDVRSAATRASAVHSFVRSRSLPGAEIDKEREADFTRVLFSELAQNERLAHSARYHGHRAAHEARAPEK
jgi:hypothetical protein